MKIVLVGNQNSGKSTLFNTLTDSNQKIGNWPGVTIEKKTGIIKNTKFELIDLPGIYSLNPYTKEEIITTNFIYEESADVIINIVDCNSINRGLYLTTQLLELNKKIIIVLNMYDIAESKGIIVDENKLSQSLNNVKIIKISAVTGIGCDKLVDELKQINKILKDNKKFNIDNKKSDINNKKIEKNNKKTDANQTILKNKSYLTNAKKYQVSDKKIIEEKIIEEKYKFIDNVLANSVIYTKTNMETLTDKLDKILLNKILAIPIFVIIMFIIYYFSIEVVGNKTIDIINSLFELLSQKIEKYLSSNNVNKALISLLTNGIINGVSAVISFLPQLTFLFVAISYLEKIGYMSRISLVFDKIFKKLGISGNSVISFIIGTGCSVPGIMATKTIKNEREKKITTILTPFIPCSAKLPIISLFNTYFFRENSGLIAISFYILAVVIIIISSLILKKVNKGLHETSYISELPEFRRPKLSQVLKDSFERVFDFIKRAGSIILLSSIIVWILLSYSINIDFSNNVISQVQLSYGANVQDSILADIGKSFSWIFIPMLGENSWEIAVSSVQGLIAKEQVISSMAIIAGLETENTSSSIFVQGQGSPFEFFTPLSAYAYVCFNLFSAPCFGAISAMKKALGGTKSMLKAIAYQVGVAYMVSCLIYNIGNLILN